MRTLLQINYPDVKIIISLLILLFLLFVLSAGRSPYLKINRASSAIIGSCFIIIFGILNFDQAVSSVDIRTIAILFK